MARMSLHPELYKVSSMRSLIKLIGSNDLSILERAVAQADGRKISARLKKGITSFLAGNLRNGKEPAIWLECCLPVAKAAGLTDGVSISGDDYKFWAWADFAALFGERVDESLAPLVYSLAGGRPFVGTEHAGDGTYYAWLLSDEMAKLRPALEVVAAVNPKFVEQLDGFYEDFLGWLDACDGADLLLIAT